MPPILSAISSLSNAELASKLREYGVEVGPIIATTRSVYEKKLLRLESGMDVVSPSKYEPVDDDEESDEEDLMETVQTRSTQNPLRKRSPVRQTYSEPRRRPDAIPSRIPRKEGAGDPVSTPLRAPPRRTPQTATTSQKKGIPLWVKLSVFVVVVVFAFLIVKNMESNAQSNIPQEIEAEV